MTPFLRSTQNQIQQFYLNRATNFVSGLNVGNQTSRGFEFELDKGDFSREGLSAKLSFAYTNSYIKYNTLSNGSTVLTPVIDAINSYNALTKAGGGAPCYTLATATTAGVAAPACGAGTVANPYYNAPEQSVAPFESGASQIPYDTIPSGIGVGATQYGVPYVTSLVLNEKIGKVSITPIVQFFAGQRYGAPLTNLGVDPTSCTAVLGGSTTGDPRYTYGAAGGSPYNAADCSSLAAGIPNTSTGSFDQLGAFVEPSQLLMHVQLAYEATKNFTLTANFSNIINTCFNAQNEPWNVANACSYNISNAGTSAPAYGNFYNPGEVLQPYGKYSYSPVFSQQPFGVAVSAQLKL